jgi:hypothetical protein
MDEKRYSALPFLLALLAWVTLATSFALWLLFFSKHGLPIGEDRDILVHNMGTIALCLFCMGWTPGLALAVVSLIMLRRSQNLLQKIVVRILSPLAIIAAILWSILALLTLINNIPGHS